MKTLKTLLLGGIFVLFGIFNFSSAYEVSIVSPSAESRLRLYFEDIIGVNSFSTPGDYIFCNGGIFNRCGWDLDNSKRRCFNANRPDGVLCSVSPFMFEPGSYNVNFSCNSFPCSVLIKTGYPVSVYGTYEFDPPILLNGVSEFTPIITGLTTSINEFIPYIVYVGLGVLGVVIGFFAIKRLMRYVKGSTLSVFSSRRKKK